MAGEEVDSLAEPEPGVYHAAPLWPTILRALA